MNQSTRALQRATREAFWHQRNLEKQSRTFKSTAVSRRKAKMKSLRRQAGRGRAHPDYRFRR